MEKELWFTAPKKLTLKEVSVPKLNHHQLLVRAKYSLISSGTENLIFNRTIPNEVKHQMMVPYMKGDFDSSFTYGYSLSGEIIQGNSNLIGQNMHLLHPHQTYAVIDSDDFKTVPNTINLKKLTLASNVETAVNAVWDAKISIGDRVLIVGFGLIGALIAGVLKSISSLDILVAETNAFRVSLAKELGFNILSENMMGSFDKSFHTTSSEKGFETALDALGYEGQLTEVSWYGDKEIKVSFGKDFHTKRKQIVCSQVSNIPTQQMARWDYVRRKELVYKILEDDYFDQLPFEEIAFDDIEKAYQNLTNQNENLGIIIKY